MTHEDAHFGGVLRQFGQHGDGGRFVRRARSHLILRGGWRFIFPAEAFADGDGIASQLTGQHHGAGGFGAIKANAPADANMEIGAVVIFGDGLEGGYSTQALNCRLSE